MAYQVLARKWRPRSFESLVGQEHVVKALTHALSDGRLHHAYLFTGTRGVGKTTLARILAKALNCETGVTAKPCGVCSACTEIDAGRFVDLLEVDAATNTKVEEMRQLLENSVYAPTRGRFKVYVIDEVHMLSTSAFNAMLKTLEEPPEHVKFILATTDPQKIPVTVLSRCLQFNLKQMTPPLIAAHLKHILAEEAIAAEPGALNLIARSASGSMRDALSLLDQAIAHGAGTVEEAGVRDMLGSVDTDYLFTILDALLADDVAAMLRVAEDMATRSLSFATALQELASLLTRLQVAQLAPQALADELPERERLLQLAAQLSPEYVQLAYQIAVQGRNELHWAPDEQDGFVMTLLRLYAFRPMTADDASPSPHRPADDGNASPVGARNSQAALAITPMKASRTVRPTAKPVSPEQIRIEESSPAPAAPSAKTGAGSFDATYAPPAPATDVGHDEPEVVGNARHEEHDWHALLAALDLGGMARELAQNCELQSIDRYRVLLNLAPEQRHLLLGSAQERLQTALSEHLGRDMKLLIEQGEIVGDTPAAVAMKRREQKQMEAENSVRQDAFVREVIDIFDARLIEQSIKPV